MELFFLLGTTTGTAMDLRCMNRGEVHGDTEEFFNEFGESVTGCYCECPLGFFGLHCEYDDSDLNNLRNSDDTSVDDGSDMMWMTCPDGTVAVSMADCERN